MEITFLFVALLVGLLPAFIANSKGRSFFEWYLYGFFLFPFAAIHSMLIKPNENAKGMCKCPSCASIISAEAIICPMCRTNLVKDKVDLDKPYIVQPIETTEPIKLGKMAIGAIIFAILLLIGISVQTARKHSAALAAKELEAQKLEEKQVAEEKAYIKNNLNELLAAIELNDQETYNKMDCNQLSDLIKSYPNSDYSKQVKAYMFNRFGKWTCQ